MDPKIKDADIVIKGAPPAILFEVLEVLAVTLAEENEPGAAEEITLEELIINGVIKVALIPIIVLTLVWLYPY